MLFKRRLSVKKEIFYLSLLSFAIILLVFGILFAKSLFDISKESARRSILETNRQISVFAGGFFSEITNTLNMLAMHDDIRFFSRNDDEAYRRALALYQNILKSNKNILYVYSGYPDKYLLINDYTPPEWFDPTERPWYLSALQAMPGIATGVPYHEANSGEWVIAPSKALIDRHGNVSGVVSIDISLESITRLLRERYLYETQVSYAVGNGGLILIHPDEDRIGKTVPRSVQNKITGIRGAFEYEDDCDKLWAHYDTIESNGWIFITEVAQKEILAPILSRIFFYILFIFGVSCLLGVLQSRFLGRRFAAPLIDLGERVAAITAGRPRRETTYGYSNSEIAAIAENIEHLAETSFSRKAMELKVIIESTQDGILVVNQFRKVIYINSRFRQMWHLGQEAREGANEAKLLQSIRDQLADPGGFMETVEALYASDHKALKSVEFRDGRIYEVFTAPLISDAQVVGRIWSFRDITERKNMENELVRLAATDNLTGLLNRRVFLEKLEAEMHRCKRYDNTATVMMLDLDYFKSVNDTYGHAGGDIVLNEFARLLRENTRSTDVLSRLGGEEFAILLPETTLSAAMPLAQRILHSTRKSVVATDAGEIRFTVSIGLAQLHANDTRTDQLLAKADAALYRAKDNGRDRAEVGKLGSE